MLNNTKITIIILSFNDSRIVDAINSAIKFDDNNSCKIIVIVGGSNQNLLNIINKNLRNHDELYSRKDKGIFDGFNRGLSKISSPYVGWLGSDDIYEPSLRASTILDYFKNDVDIVTGNAFHLNGTRLNRVTKAWPTRYKLNFIGMHNSHFATFGKIDLFCKYSFDIECKVADIDYFLKVIRNAKKIKCVNRTFTHMQLGGFSTSSLSSIIKSNLLLASTYRNYLIFPLNYLAVIIKILSKIPSVLFYKIFKYNVMH